MKRLHVHAACALTTGDVGRTQAALVVPGDLGPTQAVPVVHVASLASHLDARLRRGASTMTRLLIEASTRVTPTPLRATVRVIHGAAWGEVDTALALMNQLLRGEPLSPARFKASVHNNASGLLSITDANHEGHTAITAGESTLAACLIEAWGLLAEDATRPVVIAIADEPVPQEFGATDPGPPLAIGLRLSANAAGALASLSFPKPSRSPTVDALHRPTLPSVELVARILHSSPLETPERVEPIELGGGWSTEVST